MPDLHEDEIGFGDESLGRNRRRVFRCGQGIGVLPPPVADANNVVVVPEEGYSKADTLRMMVFFLQNAVLCGLITLAFISLAPQSALGFRVSMGFVGWGIVILIPVLALSAYLTEVLPIKAINKLRWWIH